MREHSLFSQNKLETVLSYFLLLFLPTQLGKHFWPSFAYILGQRIDYLSPTVYFTDLLTACLFALWIWGIIYRKFKVVTNNSKPLSLYPNVTLRKKLFLGILIVGFILTTIIVSKSSLLAWYYLLKIAEMLFFGWYIAKFFLSRKQVSLLLLSTGIIFESFLAIVQSYSQHSLNGIFYFLGERMFSGQTPGIANVSLHGVLILRPYGTFPHPNVLGGYLTIIMTTIISAFPNDKSLVSNIKRSFFLTVLIIGTIALFLTLSRIAIILWIVVLSFWLITTHWKFLNEKIFLTRYTIFAICFILLLGVTFVFSPLFYRFTQFSFGDESVVYREELASSAIAMVLQHPIFGIGLHNFLVALPSFETMHSNVLALQPVHNIFLLIAAETGVPGLLLTVWFLYKIGKRNLQAKKINDSSLLLAEVIVLGMFDHYFLTLQQGQLLFAFVLGLSFLQSSMFEKV